MYRDSFGRSLATGLTADQCQRCGAPASGKGSWNTKGDCHTCGDPCCDACSVVDEQGLVCAQCVALAVELLYEFGDVTEVVN